MKSLNGYLLAAVFGLCLVFGCDSPIAPDPIAEINAVEQQTVPPPPGYPPRDFPHGLPLISAFASIVNEMTQEQIVVENRGRFMWRFNIGGEWYSFHYWDETNFNDPPTVRFMTVLSIIARMSEIYAVGMAQDWDESHYYPQGNDNGFIFWMTWDGTKYAAIGRSSDQTGCWHQPINYYRDCES